MDKDARIGTPKQSDGETRVQRQRQKQGERERERDKPARFKSGEKTQDIEDREKERPKAEAKTSR